MAIVSHQAHRRVSVRMKGRGEMRTILDNELGKISADIRLLAEMANHSILRATTALLNRDITEAREVKRGDRSTDQLRYEVENTCMSIIATQQPVARDLRKLVATTFIATELERCGDYAKGIAKATRRISKANLEIKPYDLAKMETLARGMLERAVVAFLGVDVAAARTVMQDDAHIDTLYDELLITVTTDMNTRVLNIESGVWLLHAGHCLERFADRATNIAERVMYVDTGISSVKEQANNGHSGR